MKICNGRNDAAGRDAKASRAARNGQGNTTADRRDPGFYAYDRRGRSYIRRTAKIDRRACRVTTLKLWGRY